MQSARFPVSVTLAGEPLTIRAGVMDVEQQATVRAESPIVAPHGPIKQGEGTLVALVAGMYTSSIQSPLDPVRTALPRYFGRTERPDHALAVDLAYRSPRGVTDRAGRSGTVRSGYTKLVGNRYGSDGSLFVARICWFKPNNNV